MKFYSGFSLKNDSVFFKDYIKDSQYMACGFSYGAIKAFKYVKEQLACGNRIDTLQLFSPAFFETKSDKFKRLQTISYSKSKNRYLSQFLESCFKPYKKQDVALVESSVEELNELLSYEWSVSELRYIADNGVSIEVYLGGKDEIIDVKAAKELFIDVATVTYIKNANHFLQTK